MPWQGGGVKVARCLDTTGAGGYYWGMNKNTASRITPIIAHLADHELFLDDMIDMANDDATDLDLINDADLIAFIVIFFASMLEDDVFAGDTDLDDAQGMMAIAHRIDPTESALAAELRDAIRHNTTLTI